MAFVAFGIVGAIVKRRSQFFLLGSFVFIDVNLAVSLLCFLCMRSSINEASLEAPRTTTAYSRPERHLIRRYGGGTSSAQQCPLATAHNSSSSHGGPSTQHCPFSASAQHMPKYSRLPATTSATHSRSQNDDGLDRIQDWMAELRRAAASADTSTIHRVHNQMAAFYRRQKEQQQRRGGNEDRRRRLSGYDPPRINVDSGSPTSSNSGLAPSSWRSESFRMAGRGHNRSHSYIDLRPFEGIPPPPAYEQIYPSSCNDLSARDAGDMV